jgi:hypothetical protein
LISEAYAVWSGEIRSPTNAARPTSHIDVSIEAKHAGSRAGRVRCGTEGVGDAPDGRDCEPEGIDVVAALCRVHLYARRLGCTIRVTEASDELRDLITFVGLDGVLLDDARREVEEREEAGVNEAVDAGDETV